MRARNLEGWEDPSLSRTSCPGLSLEGIMEEGRRDPKPHEEIKELKCLPSEHQDQSEEKERRWGGRTLLKVEPHTLTPKAKPLVEISVLFSDLLHMLGLNNSPHGLRKWELRKKAGCDLLCWNGARDICVQCWVSTLHMCAYMSM